jgi:hypothetical protein
VKEQDRTSFSERLKAAAEAKRVLLAKFQPKPMVVSAQPIDRIAEKQARLTTVRQARIAARAAKAEADQAGIADLEAAALAAKRQDRKARKAMNKTKGKAKREASRRPPAI